MARRRWRISPMARPLRAISEHNARISTWREHPLQRNDLGHAVECAWEGRGGWARPMRVLPDGCVDLVWTGEHLLATPAVPVATRVPVAAEGQVVGLRLVCGMGAAIVGTPLDGPRPVDLRKLWRGLGEAGVAQLRRVREPAVAASILEDLVLARLADGATADPMVLRSIGDLRHASVTVAELARRAGVTPRALHRRFVAQVGFGPKRLQRLFRFDALRRRLSAPGAKPDAALAVELGFFDQAHMIRECRAIAGSAPRAFMS
jgi:AraC-like DNA-binding protein